MIDIHAHLLPPEALVLLEGRAAELGIAIHRDAAGTTHLEFDYGLKVRPFLPRMLDVQQRLADMDAQGVTLEVLSAWTDIFGYGMPAATGLGWHSLLNDALAGLCRAHPDRFAFVASAPLQAPEDAARELARAVQDLGAVGGAVACNVEGVNLGEAPLDAFWDMAERLEVPVFLHPVHPVPPPRAERFGLAQSAAYTYDTTLAVVSLIANGVLDRFPRLQLVLPHGGGTVPFLVGRLDCVHQRMGERTGDIARHDPSHYLSRFHFDTIVFEPKVLRFLADLVGPERLLIGTDLPFPPAEREPMDFLRRSGFDAATIRMITQETPRRLFQRLG